MDSSLNRLKKIKEIHKRLNSKEAACHLGYFYTACEKNVHFFPPKPSKNLHFFWLFSFWQHFFVPLITLSTGDRTTNISNMKKYDSSKCAQVNLPASGLVCAAPHSKREARFSACFEDLSVSRNMRNESFISVAEWLILPRGCLEARWAFSYLLPSATTTHPVWATGVN